MRTHSQRTISRCFAALRQLRQTRQLVPPTTFQTLVVVFVLSRLDYGNGVLVGLPAYRVRRLQSALNASARLIHNLHRSEHITGALVSLHWQRVPERIQYKIAVLAYKVLHGTAPRCRARFSVCLIYQVGMLCVLPVLVVWSFHRLNYLRLAVEPSRSLLLEHGTIYRRT